MNLHNEKKLVSEFPLFDKDRIWIKHLHEPPRHITIAYTVIETNIDETWLVVNYGAVIHRANKINDGWNKKQHTQTAQYRLKNMPMTIWIKYKTIEKIHNFISGELRAALGIFGCHGTRKNQPTILCESSLKPAPIYESMKKAQILGNNAHRWKMEKDINNIWRTFYGNK